MKKLIIFIILILFSINSYALYIHDRMYEGQTKIYSNNGFYVVKLVTVSDTEKTAYFMVNNELSDELDEDSNYYYIFKDKSEVVIDDILISEVGEPKPDLVDFYFFGSMNNPYPMEDLPKYIKDSIEEKIIEEDNKTEEIKNITIIKDDKEKKKIEKEKEEVKERNIFQIIIDFFKRLFLR